MKEHVHSKKTKEKLDRLKNGERGKQRVSEKERAPPSLYPAPLLIPPALLSHAPSRTYSLAPHSLFFFHIIA